ncbi:nuclease [Tamilnaduibacter salinus]|uniref:Nuclease n=1 Tax=Tamilnaduibacter salinus TaxID=1484056 RepID=A0A2A2HZ55_9GAMM|nr:VRR-NUC domain-containing protein [Tamilnaduibacter salinus]PAV24931.1 nuclease [Tamilnaduibacter salinus]
MTSQHRSSATRPATASLEDPLYYLRNFETVVGWVRSRHGDLLTGEETARLDNLMALSSPARALLVRLVMRRGDLFRRSRLHYDELGADVDTALGELARDQWIDDQPELTIDELFHLLTLPELREAFSRTIRSRALPRSQRKSDLLMHLRASLPESKPMADWWPDRHEIIVRFLADDLFERLRLMFFGNLRQDWSDFVLVELGHQRYESVPLSTKSRAFQTREAVDRYLLMQRCRDRLDEGESPATVWPDLPARDDDNAWLESRRSRLLLELGRLAHRAGDTALALNAWADSGHRDARVRRLRLLEREGQHQRAWDELTAAMDAPRSDSETRALERLWKRLAKRLNRAVPASDPSAGAPETTLTLPNPDGLPVEWVVQAHLQRENAPVFYVENTLLNGLFGLLCWPALYAPLPGAFFHPFHAGPADLYREDFVARRQSLFDDCLAALDRGDYRERIRTTWREKWGITCPLVVWSALPESLLELALSLIPPEHLRVVFDRLLRDLRHNRSGLPDLIRFDRQHRGYEMIEVKGPGDRLQDHQRHWLEFGLSHGLPMAVYHVRWAETDP